MNKKKSLKSAPEPDNDDILIGRVLTRREVIKLLGATGSALFLSACFPSQRASPDSTAVVENTSVVNGTSLPVCVARPELAEGPLFTEQELNRADIRSDPASEIISAGAQLDLTFRLSNLVNNGCTPLPQAQIDIWHCDADGIYSDTDLLDMDTVGQNFLRGYQLSDQNGIAQFTTIYPGWYRERAVHIHFKIRTDDGYEFNSQLFFDESFTDQVFAQPPYNGRGERPIRNENDGIFRQAGDQMILTVVPNDTGYAAEFDIALDRS